MDRITADILLVEGTGPDARAHLHTDADPDNPVCVDASLIAEGTGYRVDELPGKTVVALVDECGELAGFERR